MVKGQPKYSVVLPFTVLLTCEVAAETIEKASVEAAAWIELSLSTCEGMAAANQLIALRTLGSLHLPDNPIAGMRASAIEAMNYCSRAERNCDYAVGNAVNLFEAIFSK